MSKLETLDPERLLAVWQQLHQAKMLAVSREQLEFQILDALVRKDVEIALTRFSEHLSDPGGERGSQLFEAFRGWVVEVPTRAGFWLDARIDDGTMADKWFNNLPVRTLYERELIRSLLLANPDQAALRLLKIPEDLRVSTLLGADSLSSEAAYAALVRQYFGQDECVREFVRMARSTAYREGTTGVDKFLSRISATSSERGIILLEIQGAITR